MNAHHRLQQLPTPTDTTPEEKPPDIKLYYRNNMSSSYEADEKALQKIIKDIVKPVEPNTELKLIIYYNSNKTSNLIMKNSCLPKCEPLQEANVIYQYTCTTGD